MKKATHRTPREDVRYLQQIINIGPAMEADLKLLGMQQPAQLAGQDPLQLYRAMCRRKGQRQDPCVLDVLMSAVDFMNGQPPRPWWHFTPKRKQTYGNALPLHVRQAPGARAAGSGIARKKTRSKKTGRTVASR